MSATDAVTAADGTFPPNFFVTKRAANNNAFGIYAESVRAGSSGAEVSLGSQVVNEVSIW